MFQEYNSITNLNRIALFDHKVFSVGPVSSVCTVSGIPRGGTFEHVIIAYLASPEWARLADRTRYVWRRIVERIRTRWGDTAIELWSAPHQLQEILFWRNEYRHQPRTADHQLTVLHHILAWARLHGLVSTNIAANIPRLYGPGTRAEIIWHPDEIERFCSSAPQHVADGMRLAAMTGLRRADLVALKWSEIDQLSIKRVTLKSGRLLAAATALVDGQ